MSDVQELQKDPNQKSVFDQIDSGEITGKTKAVATPAAAAKSLSAAGVDASTINMLAQVLSLIAAKEARELQKEEQGLVHQKQRDQRRAENAKGEEYKRIATQAKCTHRKGGTAVKDSKLDYNVGTHTFPDGTCVISCLTCRAKWRKDDTAEYFLRKGRKVANHTHIGWREAVNMYRQSTNTITKSEIDPAVLIPGAASKPKYGGGIDGVGVVMDNQVRDTDGNVVADFEL